MNKSVCFLLAVTTMLLLFSSCSSVEKPQSPTASPQKTTTPQLTDVHSWEKADSSQCTAHLEGTPENDVVLYMPEKIEIHGEYQGVVEIQKYNATTLLIANGTDVRKIPLYPDEIKELNALYCSVTDFCSPDEETSNTYLYHNGHWHPFYDWNTSQSALAQYIDLLRDYFDGKVNNSLQLYDENGNLSASIFDGKLMMPDKIVIHDYCDESTLTIENMWKNSNYPYSTYHISFIGVDKQSEYLYKESYENIYVTVDEAAELNRLYEAITDFSGEVLQDGSLVEIYRGDTVERFTLGHASQAECNQYLELLLDYWYVPR